MSPTTAHALAIVAFCMMFLCWGIAYVMLRLESQPSGIAQNAPRKSSESDHSKAPTLVPVTMPGSKHGIIGRNAFGLTHMQTLAPLDAHSMAREALGDPENLFPGTENVRR